MSLEDLGNIGEFVAAVAVVISLIYLAVQIRQNTRQIDENTASLRVTASDETLRSFSHYREHMIRDPDIADLYLRGCKSLHDLDRRDRLRFALLASELFYTYQSVHQRSVSLGAAELWEYVGGSGSLLPALQQPGIQEWWNCSRGEFTEEFAAEIDLLLRRIDEAKGSGDDT